MLDDGGEWFLTRLKKIQRWGVKLYLGGELSTPQEIAKCLVKEDCNYVPDFYYDDEGNLNEVHYENVKE